jgi:hypothetical protein
LKAQTCQPFFPLGAISSTKSGKASLNVRANKRNSNENKIEHTTKANSKHAQAGTSHQTQIALTIA